MTAAFLESQRDAILAEATAAALRAPWYASLGVDETDRRLGALFEQLVAAVERNDLTAIVGYARELAPARFTRGCVLSEVQVAMNALEEAIWRRVFATLPPEDAGEAVRLVSTALGAAKDALAREYVRLAAADTAPAVDVEALMSGKTAG